MTDSDHALHGDGINFAFFNFLWSKREDGDRRKDPFDSGRGRIQSGETKGEEELNPTNLRVPDTVVFLFGQPHHWYFTSNNGGPDRDKSTILRKRRSNLTLANIAEVFLNKAGEVGEDDVVAYFIGTNEYHELDGRTHIHVSSGEEIENGALSSIDYFNKKSLHDFLQSGRNNKSGILQRFITPHGRSHNSHIRAIWTPKLCILDRRRTKQNLNDTRFGLYERCITFEGPDNYSVSLPLQGTVLAKRVEGICKDIVRHVAGVITEGTRGGNSRRVMSSISSKNYTDNIVFNVARMIVDFKVDGNGRIWILWSNSIRLQCLSAENRMKLNEPHAIHDVEPLNMDMLVRLPSSSKLTQTPNHNANIKLENKWACTNCPSCNKHDVNQNFQPVSYKTIIQHSEKTLEMLCGTDGTHPSNAWPPYDLFIKAVGNVGFGSLHQQIARERETHTSLKDFKETLAIPPIIRELHPKLQVNGYNIYRQDPLFLLKTADVCESCFLSFAQMASISFTHVTRSIEPVGDKRVHYAVLDAESEKASDFGTKINTQSSNSCFCNEYGSVPEFPLAILEPSDTVIHPTSRDTLFNTIPAYFPNNDSAQKNLRHMIDSHQMLAAAKKTEIQVAATSKNLYQEKME